jgi:hypothetical protein
MPIFALPVAARGVASPGRYLFCNPLPGGGHETTLRENFEVCLCVTPYDDSR